MDNSQQLIAQCEQVAKQWMTSDCYDAETQKAVKAMVENPDKTELIDSFYRTLEFGTGGLRGIMGAGTNRMNIYTVGAATQGLSNYLNKNFKAFKTRRVWVCDTGESHFFVRIPFHPDVLLHELAAVLHPELFPGYRHVYYHHLDR